MRRGAQKVTIVEGEFGKGIVVKANAAEVLLRELNPRRKRIPLKRSYIILGGIIARKYRISGRIPPRLYKDILSENDLVAVILEQIDCLLKLEGRKSPFGYAAYSISKIKEPLAAMKGRLRELKGVGRVTEDIILEILEIESSSYHARLLTGNFSTNECSPVAFPIH